MGRRPDTPEAQQAKGNPGRRKGKMAARQAKLDRITELLTPVAGGAEVPPPAFLLEVGFEVALAVWKRLAPELMRTHRLPVDSRDTFAIYCTNYAEWLETQIDINDHGRTQKVKTVAGGFMERDRPSVRHRQTAFDNVLKLAADFGLTPRDMYSLFKDQAGAVSNNPGLFDQPGAAKAAPKESEAAAPVPSVPAGPLASAARYRSTPPGAAGTA